MDFQNSGGCVASWSETNHDRQPNFNNNSSPKSSLNTPSSHTLNLNDTNSLNSKPNFIITSSPEPNPNIPRSPKPISNILSSSEVLVINESIVLNDTTEEIQQLKVEHSYSSFSQTSLAIYDDISETKFCPPQHFVPDTSLNDIVQLNQSDSVLSSQLFGSFLVLSPSASSTPPEQVFANHQLDVHNLYQSIVLLRRCDVSKCLARLAKQRRNKRRRVARALKRQQTLASQNKSLNGTPKSPAQLSKILKPTIEYPICTMIHLPTPRKDMSKAMEAENVKPAIVEQMPNMTNFTKPPVMKRGRGRPPKNMVICTFFYNALIMLLCF